MDDVISFEGVVEVGDGSRVDYDCKEGAVHVGGADVVAEVYDWVSSIGDSRVLVSIQELQYEGTPKVDIGWGYSEYTPMEHDEIFVGPHNIVEIIESYEGKPIRVKFTKM